MKITRKLAADIRQACQDIGRCRVELGMRAMADGELDDVSYNEMLWAEDADLSDTVPAHRAVGDELELVDGFAVLDCYCYAPDGGLIGNQFIGVAADGTVYHAPHEPYGYIADKARENITYGWRIESLRQTCCKVAGLVESAPPALVYDRLLDASRHDLLDVMEMIPRLRL